MPMSTDRRMQYMQPADLKPAPDNPRKHSAEQIQKLAKSMKAFGVVAPVIVDSQGQLIAGHARREAALVAGIVLVASMGASLFAVGFWHIIYG